MYTSRAFVETDLVELDRLIARDAFVTLVTVADGVPCISHLPVLYAREGDRIVIEGHWAKPNPQARHAGPALLIVHGPHAYLSPGWYADKEEAARVPTWNYAVAHLQGAVDTFEDDASSTAPPRPSRPKRRNSACQNEFCHFLPLASWAGKSSATGHFLA